MGTLRSLKEVIGQHRAIKLLLSALQNKRLHHAYLFSGPEGVGKETTALTLTYHLFCELQGEEPCGGCNSCERLDRACHPDLCIIEPEKREIKIGQIREIERKLHYRPFSAPYKVIIIKQAERLNLEAGNAMLKSLEEPPPYVLFILLTTNVSRLLPTIVSRCQVVQFSPLSKGLIQTYLMQRLDYEVNHAETLAELSGGSLGRAIEIAQKGFLEDLHAFIQAGRSGSAGARFRISERLAKLPPEDQKKFLGLLMLWILRSYFKHKGVLTYPPGLPEHTFGGDLWKAASTIKLTETALESYVQPELSFYHLLLQLFAKE